MEGSTMIFLLVGANFLVGKSIFLLWAAHVARTKYHQLQAFQISPKQNSFLTSASWVNGARQCGGQGKFLEWRDEACNYTQSDVCQVSTNKFQRGEISFIPKDSSDSLSVRLIVRDPSKSGSLVGEVHSPSLSNSAVTSGQEYTISGGSVFDDSLRGKMVTVQVSIYRSRDKWEELCAEADYYIM